MKSNRGKGILLLWCFVTGALFGASDYSWSVNLSSASIHQNEAVEIHYTCRFKDQGGLYSIEMDPKAETPHYSLHVLSEKEQIRDGIRTNEYRYVLVGKDVGNAIFEPTALMRKTTRASIEETVIGRDNIEELVFTDTKVMLPKVELAVTPTRSAYSGKFSLDMKISSLDVKAYEPVHVTVRIEGEGNLDALKPVAFEIDGVEQFMEAPEPNYHLGAHGFRGTWVQRFALVSGKDFTIPELKLHYFDLDEKREKTVGTEAVQIAVAAAVQKEELLDSDESAPWQWQWSYLFYLLTFITGFVIGKWLRFGPSEKAQPNTFEAKIEACENVKQLLTLLVLTDASRFHMLIAELEEKSTSLERAKQEVLKVLHAG